MPAADQPPKILVLVHPGSACGSADMNLGKSLANAYRAGLVRELDAWTGGIIVINGDLSDEIPKYPAYQTAIKTCLARAQTAGLISSAVWGDDDGTPDQDDAIRDAIGLLKLPMNVKFCLTGAWYDPSNRTGCVNSVYDAIAKLNRPVEVLDSACQLDFLGADENQDA